MRLEYRSRLLTLRAWVIAFLLLSAVLGAVALSMDGEETKRVLRLSAGIAGAAALMIFGFYLLLSDTARLLKNTVYGRALAEWGEGDARGLLRAIDREALEDHYEGRFALLANWMILYRPTPYDARGVASFPIPRAMIEGISWRQEGGENKRYQVVIRCGGEKRFSTVVWADEEIRALRAWQGDVLP